MSPPQASETCASTNSATSASRVEWNIRTRAAGCQARVFGRLLAAQDVAEDVADAAGADTRVAVPVAVFVALLEALTETAAVSINVAVSVAVANRRVAVGALVAVSAVVASVAIITSRTVTFIVADVTACDEFGAVVDAPLSGLLAVAIADVVVILT